VKPIRQAFRVEDLATPLAGARVVVFHAGDRLTGVLSSHTTHAALSGYCRKISMISQGRVFVGSEPPAVTAS
jgi:hypothetical protein